MADSFSVQLSSSLTYICNAAVVNLRTVAHTLEVGSKGGSIVIKRDSLMHRDLWVNSRDISRIEKKWRARTLCVRSLRHGNYIGCDRSSLLKL